MVGGEVYTKFHLFRGVLSTLLPCDVVRHAVLCGAVIRFLTHPIGSLRACSSTVACMWWVCRAGIMRGSIILAALVISSGGGGVSAQKKVIEKIFSKKALSSPLKSKLGNVSCHVRFYTAEI